MPEMTQFIGKRFAVSRRVEKICDTLEMSGSRRVRDTVFLDDLRCSGAVHGGCQAECRIYWKEAWLVKAEAGTNSISSSVEGVSALERLTEASTTVEGGDHDVFRCQATEAIRATEAIPSVFSPGQYARELSCGNIGAWEFISVAIRALSWKAGVMLGMNVGSRKRAPYVETAAKSRPREKTHTLEPGDWVEVKSADEIGTTLDAKGTNRGLQFSPCEMLPACGRRFRVRRQINKLIDEKTGRLLNIKNDCIALDGFVCNGRRSTGRWFCPRELYPYWRESWLTKIEPPQP